MRTTSQIYKIYKWLESGRSLTQIQALKLFDCMRLGAVKYRLEKELGIMDIDSKLIKTKSGKYVSQYKKKT